MLKFYIAQDLPCFIKMFLTEANLILLHGIHNLLLTYFKAKWGSKDATPGSK